MDSSTKKSASEIDELLFKQRSCTSCPLHVHRKTLIAGVGSTAADIVAVVDRVSPTGATVGNIYSGGEGRYLEALFKRSGIDPKYIWVTPVVSCPTGTLRSTRGRVEMLPAPKKSEVQECSSRLHKEIHLIEPALIFAFGSASVSALAPKAKYTEVSGRVSEASIQGDLVTYPVPMMALPSINQLYRNPAQKVGGIWNKTVDYIREGLDVAFTLSQLRRKHG